MNNYSKVLRLMSFILFLVVLGAVAGTRAQDAKPASGAAPDVLVLSDGDVLHGKLVKAVGGKVTFHTGSLGDVEVAWDKIKELHAAEKFSVLEKSVKLRGKKSTAQIPTGTIDVEGAAITVHGENAPAAPIAVKNAAFVVDADAMDNQIHREPSFFGGWNGAATAGATLVQATQNQYTFSGGIGLVRTVPTVSWLDPRNRTQFDFTGSFGKITQPGTTPSKSAIYHMDVERDEYISSRLFLLVQAAWDHNFAQDLQLQQIYGGGLGVALMKMPRQEADAKATVQYEKQSFIGGTEGNQNLIGSTFALNYVRRSRLFAFTQELDFVPAYNTPSAYSASENDTVAFPTYKNFAFSVGTIDSYLNNAPMGAKRNSFQFTMGMTYAFKSKY